MIAQQIDYFRQIAITMKDIAHSTDLNQKQGFFCHDLKIMMDEINKCDTVMFLPEFQGNLKDNRSDNLLDEARIQWSIMQRMGNESQQEIERIQVATKAIALKIISRMKWHQEGGEEGRYCDLLLYFDLDEVEYRTESIYQDDWTGIRVITPLTSGLELEMNPSDWLAPPLALPSQPDR